MKSSYVTNALLLLLVIGLVWFLQLKTEHTAETTTLSLMKASDIQQITIQRHEQTMIELTHEQSGWHIKQPFLAAANDTRIKLLLSLLSSPIHGQFHPMDQSSLAQFGLASPLMRVTFNDQAFVFGNIEPISDNRYVMYNNVIYLIDDTVMPMLKANVNSFIENRLLNEKDKLVKLYLPVFNAERSHTIQFTDIHLAEGHWQSDLSTLRSDDLVSLVDHWQHAQAMQVRHLDTAALNKLSTPSVQLWLQGYSEPIQFVLTIQEQNISLTNPASQLQYSLPLALQTGLFPVADTP